MKSLNILLILLTSFPIVFSEDKKEEKETKLPESTQKRIDSYKAESKKEYNDLMKKFKDNELNRLEKLIKKLEEDKKDYTKKGDLDTAMAIDKRLGDYQVYYDILKHPLTEIGNGIDEKSGRLIENNNMNNSMVGTWSTNNGWNNIKIIFNNGNYELHMLDQVSILSVLYEDKLYINWNNTDTFIIEKSKTQNTLIMTQYTIKFIDIKDFISKSKDKEPIRKNIICSFVKKL